MPRQSRFSKTCVVCGGEIISKSRNYKAQTCNSDHCRAVLMLTPSLADPAKARPDRQPGHKRNKKAGSKGAIFRRITDCVSSQLDDLGDAESHREGALSFAVDSSDWVFGDSELTADARGLATESSRDLWGFLSRVRVAFRARTKEGTLWLHITRRSDESTADAIRRSWMGNSGWEDIYTVFLAWRCCCRLESEYIVKTLDDMPDEPGPHGNCPACGATPLFVEVEEQ